MPKLPIFRLRSSDPPSRPDLQYYGLSLAFTDLKLGVDNFRYDVFLSPRFTADLGFHLARYICRSGAGQPRLELDFPSPPPTFIPTPNPPTIPRNPVDPT